MDKRGSGLAADGVGEREEGKAEDPEGLRRTNAAAVDRHLETLREAVHGQRGELAVAGVHIGQIVAGLPLRPAAVQREPASGQRGGRQRSGEARLRQREPDADVAAPAAEETPAADGAPANGIAPPPEGKGQIVFFRDKKFTGGAISYIVRENGEELGKLSNGSYFVHVAEPGAHAYTVHSEAKDVMNLEVEPGETYYVVGSISMGILAGRPNLAPADQAAFDALSGKIKPAQPLKKKG